MGGWFACWKPEALSTKGVGARKRSYVTPGVSAEAKRTAEAKAAGDAAVRADGGAVKASEATAKMSNQEFFQGGGYEAERARQDKDLDELSSMVGDLKNLSTALGAELEAQDAQIEDLGYDVEVTGTRIKGAARRAGKLAK